MSKEFVVISDVGFKHYEARVKKALKKSLKVLKKNNLALDIYLVKDAEIRRLNLRFRGKNKVTNVLSFSTSRKFPRPDIKKSFRYVGEIYLAPHYIKIHREKIEHLVIHGLLHLLGYTHEKKHDRIRMEQLEDVLHARQADH